MENLGEKILPGYTQIFPGYTVQIKSLRLTASVKERICIALQTDIFHSELKDEAWQEIYGIFELQ